MTRTRDSQRKKFWAAFNDIQSSQPVLTDANIYDFVNEVTNSRWWKSKRPDLTDIETNLGNRPAYGTINKKPVPHEPVSNVIDGVWQLVLPRKCSKLRILISLCHSLHDPGTAWHGPEFCRVLLEATERFISQETADELRIAMKTQRIKLRSWSLQARDAARRRYAAKDLLAMRDELGGNNG